MAAGIIIAGVVIGVPLIVALLTRKGATQAPGLPGSPVIPVPQPVPTAYIPPPNSPPPPSSPPQPTVVGQYNQLGDNCQWYQITAYNNGTYGSVLIDPAKYADYNITPDTVSAYMLGQGYTTDQIWACLQTDFGFQGPPPPTGTPPPAPPPPIVSPAVNEWQGLWGWANVVDELHGIVTMHIQFDHRGPGGVYVCGLAAYLPIGGEQYGTMVGVAEKKYQFPDEPDWVTYSFDIDTVTLDSLAVSCIPGNLFGEIFDPQAQVWLAQQWVFGAFRLCPTIGVIG